MLQQMISEKNSTLVGNLACFIAYAIFGFNIISCKNIAASHLVAVLPRIIWEVVNVVFFATVVACFLIPIDQKRVRPVVVGLVNFVPKTK